MTASHVPLTFTVVTLLVLVVAAALGAARAVPLTLLAAVACDVDERAGLALVACAAVAGIAHKPAHAFDTLLPLTVAAAIPMMLAPRGTLLLVQFLEAVALAACAAIVLRVLRQVRGVVRGGG